MSYPNGKEIMKRAKKAKSQSQPKSKLYNGDLGASEPKSKLAKDTSSRKRTGRSKSKKY